MERKLTAIFSADVKGYSRLMGDDEEATIRTLTAYREAMTTLIQQHRGRVVDSPGDNLLAEFASAVDAVQGAVEIQHELQSRNVELPDERKMHYRIGINVGDVIIEGERLYGDGVNIAARLEGLAEPGGICISGTVYDQVENKLTLGYEYVGEQEVKNIAKPVRVWRIQVQESSSQQSFSPQSKGEEPQPRRVRPVHRWVVASVVLIAVTIVAVRYLPFSLLGTRHSLLGPQSSPLSPQSSALITQEAQLPLPDKPSIAVLPFTNMSGDPEQEYFSDGITEDLTTALSKLSGLFVIARHSTFVYKGKAVKVKEVSQELGVRYVLEGSVRKADGRVRINAQLVDATTGGHLWAEQYDREYKDVFALQDEIRQKIVFALQVKLTPEEQKRLRYLPTTNLEAYDALLRGTEYFFRFTKEANAQARHLFERAIELDAQYAAAYALLAWTYLEDFAFQWNPGLQTLEQAFAAAQHAVALDDSLPVVHMTLSGVYLGRKQPEQALAEAERAIALDPNFAEGYAHLGMILNATGKPAEALEQIQKALRLNPRPPFYYLFNLGVSYARLGRYEEAIAAQKQVLLRNPDFLPAHLVLAESYLAQRESLQMDPQILDRALESAQKAVALSDSHPGAHSVLARAYLSKQQYEQAIVEAERVIALEPNNADHYALLAESYLAQWDRMQTQDPQTLERALESAQKAVALSDSLPGLHGILASVYLSKMQHVQALAEAERIIALAPNEADGYVLRAAILNYAGQPEQAIAEMGQALRLNPHPPASYLYHLGQAYRLTGGVEEAITTLKRALTQDPNLWDTYYDLAVLYSEGGREEEARATVAELRRRAPHVSLAVLKQPLPYKDPAETERVLVALRKAGLE